MKPVTVFAPVRRDGDGEYVHLEGISYREGAVREAVKAQRWRSRAWNEQNRLVRIGRFRLEEIEAPADGHDDDASN